MPDDKGRRYFTVGEAAERLGLSRPKAYQMVGRGELRSLKIGGVVRIPHEEIERIERERCAVGPMRHPTRGR